MTIFAKFIYNYIHNVFTAHQFNLLSEVTYSIQNHSLEVRLIHILFYILTTSYTSIYWLFRICWNHP